eukprot:Em0031g6a
MQARFVQETKENLKEVSYLHHMNGHRSPASTNQGVKCSMPVAHLKPKRQPITNEMLGQMLSQLDRNHKPSHDRLAAIMLGFFGLLRDNTTPLYVASQNGHHDVVQPLLGAGADVNIATSVVSDVYTWRDEPPKAALVERLYLHLQDPSSSEPEPEHEDVPDATPESEDTCEEGGTTESTLYIFNQFASALHWIMATNYAADLIHYLDDFLLAGPPGQPTCSESTETMLRVCERLGIPVALDKLEGPATTITFLGITINTTLQQLQLPPDKLQEMIQRKATNGCSPLYIASIIGHLDVVKTLLEAGANINQANKLTLILLLEQHWLPASPFWLVNTLYVPTSCSGSIDRGFQRAPTKASNVPCQQPTSSQNVNRLQNEMLGPMFSQLDRDHKPSHDCLVLKPAITLGFFGLLRNGWSPLNGASEKGHLDVVKTLLEAGANIDQGNNVALVERLYLHPQDPFSEPEPEREDVPDATPESKDSSESSSEGATTESTPYIFNQFASALHWIMATNYAADLIHYLDDFLLAGPPG